MKYACIKENHGLNPIVLCCRWLNVSRAGYYEWIKWDKKPKTDELGLKVCEIFFAKKKRYGAIRIRNELKKQGIKASRKRISKAMKKYNLVAKATKKFVITTNSKHDLPVSPNLLDRNFVVNAPNIAWVADFTYINTEFGWRYLAVVIDLFDRAIVGWKIADNMKKELVIDALSMAIKRQEPAKGLIVHSDRGSQYCSYKYQETLAKHGFLSSMSRKGDPWDNAVVESFFGTLKTELIYDEKWICELILEQKVREYIEIDYNRTDQRSFLGYVSPHEFRRNWHLSQKIAA